MTRDMLLLLLARICMSTTRAMAGIVVPIYLAVIGFQGVMLGLLFTVTALTSALLTGLIGLLADRFGRKPFLVVIPWLAAGASVAFAFSRTAGVLFVCAALGSFGRGSGAGSGTIGPYQPAEQAFLADAVPARHRNSLFGRIAFASSLGALLGGGPLIALAVLLSAGQTGVSYRLEFLLAAGLALLAGVLALPVREAHRPAPAPRTVPQV
jgi:MFS family permease